MYGRVEHRCAETGCTVIEPDERLGPGAVRWTRIVGPWYCQRHRVGREEAFKAWEPRGLALDPNTGGPRDLDEEERERERAEREAAARQRRHEHRLAERRADAERLSAFERVRDEQFRREMPKGIRP
jgi:hypothetical protein